MENVRKVYGEPHEGAEIRKTISAIIQRKSDGKFLLVKWKEFGWIAPVIGGVDEQESPEKAAEREVLEETGYSAKAVRRLGDEVESHFFAENKNVWRHRIDQAVLLELIREEANPISEEESKKLEVVWMSAEEVLEKITHEYNKIGFVNYLESNE